MNAPLPVLFFPIWSTPFFSFSLPSFSFWHFNAFDFFCVFLILTIPFLLLLLVSPRLFLYPSSLFPVSKARSIVSQLTDSSSVILLLWMTHHSPAYISHIHKDASTDGWFYIAMCKVSVSELKRNKEIRLQLLAPNCILSQSGLSSREKDYFLPGACWDGWQPLFFLNLIFSPQEYLSYQIQHISGHAGQETVQMRFEILIFQSSSC